MATVVKFMKVCLTCISCYNVEEVQLYVCRFLVWSEAAILCVSFCNNIAAANML